MTYLNGSDGARFAVAYRGSDDRLRLRTYDITEAYVYGQGTTRRMQLRGTMRLSHRMQTVSLASSRGGISARQSNGTVFLLAAMKRANATLKLSSIEVTASGALRFKDSKTAGYIGRPDVGVFRRKVFNIVTQASPEFPYVVVSGYEKGFGIKLRAYSLGTDSGELTRVGSCDEAGEAYGPTTITPLGHGTRDFQGETNFFEVMTTDLDGQIQATTWRLDL